MEAKTRTKGVTGQSGGKPFGLRNPQLVGLSKPHSPATPLGAAADPSPTCRAVSGGALLSSGLRNMAPCKAQGIRGTM